MNFVGMDLSLSSFNQSVFTHTAFEECNLKECEFINTPLKGIDFSTSVIDGITINIEAYGTYNQRIAQKRVYRSSFFIDNLS